MNAVHLYVPRDLQVQVGPKNPGTLSVKHISWRALRIATIPWQRPFHWLWCEHFEECRKRQAGIYKEGGIAISRKRCRRSKSHWELLFLNSNQTISKKHRKLLNWGEITDWKLVYYCNEAQCIVQATHRPRDSKGSSRRQKLTLLISSREQSGGSN